MPGNILIIDDEEKRRSLLARIIKLEGYAVAEAANLKSAIKILNKESIGRRVGNLETFYIELRSSEPQVFETLIRQS